MNINDPKVRWAQEVADLTGLDQAIYNKMYRIADKVLTDNFEKRKILTKALYYKVCDVESEFFDRLKYLGREQNHCFFTINKTT